MQAGKAHSEALPRKPPPTSRVVRVDMPIGSRTHPALDPLSVRPLLHTLACERHQRISDTSLKKLLPHTPEYIRAKESGNIADTHGERGLMSAGGDRTPDLVFRDQRTCHRLDGTLHATRHPNVPRTFRKRRVAETVSRLTSLQEEYSLPSSRQPRRCPRRVRPRPDHHSHVPILVCTVLRLVAENSIPPEDLMQQPFKNPIPTVDIIIRVNEGVVLIKRRNPPFGWALPGGYQDAGESCEAAAVREAMEETGLDVTLETLFYVYSDPRRDPRKHTISTVFTARASGEPIGMDDAEEARIFALDALPNTLAFDHAEILRDYTRFVETGVRPSPVDR